MANKYTKQKIDIARAIHLYETGATQAEVAVALGTTQRVIWKRLKEIKYKCRPGAKREQRGDKNASWKGDNAKYAAFHYRVYKVRGAPKKCEVCGMNDPERRYEWANLAGKYADPNDYKRMCKSCHVFHDNAVRDLERR